MDSTSQQQRQHHHRQQQEQQQKEMERNRAPFLSLWKRIEMSHSHDPLCVVEKRKRIISAADAGDGPESPPPHHIHHLDHLDHLDRLVFPSPFSVVQSNAVDAFQRKKETPRGDVESRGPPILGQFSIKLDGKLNLTQFNSNSRISAHSSCWYFF